MRGALRLYLAVTLVVCSALGAVLFPEPSLVARVWPYPVKPLATRMFASMFLALAVAAGRTLARGSGSGKGALVTIAPILGLVLAAGLPLPQAWASPNLLAWVVFLGAEAGAGVLLWGVAGRRREWERGVRP